MVYSFKMDADFLTNLLPRVMHVSSALEEMTGHEDYNATLESLAHGTEDMDDNKRTRIVKERLSDLEDMAKTYGKFAPKFSEFNERRSVFGVLILTASNIDDERLLLGKEEYFPYINRDEAIEIANEYRKIHKDRSKG